MMIDINSGDAGNFEDWRRYLGKTVTIESKAEPSYFWSNERGSATSLSSRGDVYLVVEGLSGPGFISFESTIAPGSFLRKNKGRIVMEERQYNEQYNRDCSFMAHNDVFFDGYVSFEASDRQDEWIRSHNERGLELDVTQVNTFSDNNEASFLLNEAEIRRTTTTERTAITSRTTSRPYTIEPRKLGGFGPSLFIQFILYL